MWLSADGENSAAIFNKNRFTQQRNFTFSTRKSNLKQLKSMMHITAFFSMFFREGRRIKLFSQGKYIQEIVKSTENLSLLQILKRLEVISLLKWNLNNSRNFGICYFRTGENLNSNSLSIWEILDVNFGISSMGIFK